MFCKLVCLLHILLKVRKTTVINEYRKQFIQKYTPEVAFKRDYQMPVFVKTLWMISDTFFCIFVISISPLSSFTTGNAQSFIHEFTQNKFTMISILSDSYL